MEKSTLDEKPADKDVLSESATDVDNERHTDSSSTREQNPNDIATKPETAETSEKQYVTGVKLWSVLASVTLVAFLMLLDIAIIVTVSLGTTNLETREAILTATTGYSPNYLRLSLFARCWVVW
jgi:hypothetical protein